MKPRGRPLKIPDMHRNIFSIVASGKDNGKTFVMEGLITELTRRGRRVCAVKHGRHLETPDIPAKDTAKFAASGAERIIAFSDTGLFLYEQIPPTDRHLTELASQDTDLVLIEGYKSGPFHKIEVFNHRLHAIPLVQSNPELSISAIISDAQREYDIPCFGFAEVASICNYIENIAGLHQA